jgi:hypothetical protein
MEHDLTYEKRILDWLGYTIEEKDNKWIVKDNNSKEVGYIEYGPINYDPKDCYIVCYGKKIGYHMVIDSDTIKCNSARDIDHKLYYIVVKGVGDLWLRLGDKIDYPMTEQFNLFSDIYGNYSLEIDDCGYEDGIINSGAHSVKFDYYYDINGYSVHEHSHFRNKEYSENNAFKTYEFGLSYKKENEEGKSDGKELFAFTEIDDPEQTLHIDERDYKTDEFTTRNEENKTIEEFAIEDGRGIELFKRLRKLTNEILPFNVDVFYEILKDSIEEYKLEILFDEEKEKTK